MLRTPGLTVLLLAAVAALVAMAVLLDRELRAARSELVATEAHLGVTRQGLADTSVALRTLEVAHAETSSALVAERTARNRLQVDKNGLLRETAALTASLDAARAENVVAADRLAEAVAVQEGLRTAVSDAEAEVGALARQRAAVQGDLDSLTLAHAALATEHGQLGSAHHELRGQYDGLSAAYDQWNREFGTLVELQDRANGLRTDIAQMEERRQALILSRGSEGVTGFACTGSMEPKLTCLDTATWVRDFTPADIVVGATISFPATACWEESSDAWIAHRVIDLKVVDGVQHYWPKGDNNAGPDGCWVPHAAVRGYISALHKNTRPENARLRTGVNAAWEDYNAARDAYAAARAAEGCPEEGTCYVDDHSPLWGAWDALQRAFDLYACWRTNAEKSAYPGHIPHACP